MKANIVSKALSLVVLFGVVGAEAKAPETSVCLTKEERAEYLDLSKTQSEAIVERPECQRSYGAAGCLSPIDQARLRLYTERSKDCIMGQDSVLLGVWNLVARVCERSGLPAGGGLVIGRDELNLAFSKLPNWDTFLQIHVQQKINHSLATHRTGTVSFPNPKQNKISIFIYDSATNKTTQSFAEVELSPEPTLIMSTDSFGIGGDCLPGDTLKTYFKRQKP